MKKWIFERNKKLEEMKDLLTKKELYKILKQNKYDRSLLNKEIIQICMKGTKQEIEVLSYVINLEEHISEFVFDCLLKIKSINQRDV